MFFGFPPVLFRPFRRRNHSGGLTAFQNPFSVPFPFKSGGPSSAPDYAFPAERKAENKPYTEDDLMKKIGRLEVENDFLRSVSLALGLNPEKRK